jgi:hypothetical protein
MTSAKEQVIKSVFCQKTPTAKIAEISFRVKRLKEPFLLIIPLFFSLIYYINRLNPAMSQPPIFSVPLAEEK